MEPFGIAKVEDGTQLKLAATMDIRAAEPLLNSVQEALSAGGGKIVIEASSVDRLSTPCVQVLIGALQHMEQNGIPFVLKSPSDAFVTAFDDLGLFSYLMKWPVQT
ncbi:STAS domain-containing protein [Ferrovibrio sp.]|uniref:STAS domain-containing protein n=1 Tax=Ferrovibrio sp. TaxID=1917215 RepID=UPI0025C6A3D1|nr:STAS domain-containing protein [Ferrovibrio sp.]MBX3454589.1 STAS domain-containing protein [Ferrovibrio sp.]